MSEITEAKIRQAIWMLKAKKTKKAVCEHLGIAYNTKRLDAIIQEFHDKLAREEQLKKKARSKIFSKAEKQAIADSYLNGETQSAIAKQYYISPQRVKNMLMEMNVPIRARGKGKAAKVDHVVQDLEVRFKEGERVFYAPENCFAVVHEVYDEEWLEKHENGFQKYYEIYPFKPGPNGKAGRYSEPTQGIHYEIYWIFEDLSMMKLSAVKHMIRNIETHIEEYGRESYDLWIESDYNHFKTSVPRHELFPVITK